MKVPIFLEAVLALKAMVEPQSNLEEKDNPIILKDDFSSRVFPEFNKPLPAPVHSVS